MTRPTCEQCQRPQSVCYCHLLPTIDNQTPVRILQHKTEQGHAVNTARIAALSLRNCHMITAGDTISDASLQAEFVIGSQVPVLIYPRQDSILLEPGMLSADTPLLFIDASWRKSRRLLLQSEWLQQLPCYHLEIGRESRYRIRKEPAPGYISTLEAVVHSLSLLGDEASRGMLQVMDWMISKQLEYRDRR